MAKLYLLGGENVAQRDAKEINTLAFRDAGEFPSILVFPWARPSFDVNYARRRRLVDYFMTLGARSIDFAEYSNSCVELEARIACSDLLYLTGGQVSTLLCRVRESGLDTLIHAYRGVVVGRSAGAVALGAHCFVTNRYSGVRRAVKGLGLVEFSVKAHYESSADEWLMGFSKTERIYGVPSRSAVVVNDGELSFWGKVYLFENGEKREVAKTESSHHSS